MSLINQMLKDLDRRKAEGQAPRDLPQGIRVVEEHQGGSRRGWGLAVLVVIGLASAGAWWFSQRPATSAVPSAAKRWPEVSEPLAPAPTGTLPVPVPPPANPPVAGSTAATVTEPLAATQPMAVAAPPPAPRMVTAAPVPQPQAVTARPVAKPQRHRRRRRLQPEPEPAVEEPGNAAEDHFRRGGRLFREERYQDAEQELEAALRIAPQHAEARSLLARSYLADGRYQRAEELLGAGPGGAEAARMRAQIYLKQGRPELAEQALGGGAEGAAEEPAELGVRAALRQQQGRYDEAAQLYRRALRGQPGESKWWLGLAISLEAGERYQEALEAYRQVVQTGARRPLRDYVESRIGALRALH